MKIFTNTLLLFIFLLNCTLHAQIAYYPFNGNADDVTNDYNGTINGATLATDRYGNPNSAYLFDGVNDYIEIVDATAFNFGTEEFAISMWLKPLNSTQDFQMIFQKGNSGGTLPQYWLRLNDVIGSTEIRALWTNGNPPPATIDYNDANLLYDGEWHHILFQRTTQRNELYIDCVLVGTNDDTNRNISNPGSLFIGAQHPNPPTSSDIYNFYSGLIDDVAIYDKAFVSSGAIDSLCLDMTTGIIPLTDQDKFIELYPIPTTDRLHINYRTDNRTPLNIEVLSNDGKVLIAQEAIGQKGINNVELDVASLAAGHYYVRIYGEGDIPQIQSFVKINP